MPVSNIPAPVVAEVESGLVFVSKIVSAFGAYPKSAVPLTPAGVSPCPTIPSIVTRAELEVAGNPRNASMAMNKKTILFDECFIIILLYHVTAG